MSATYTSRKQAVESAVHRHMLKGVINMAGDVITESTPATPYRDGDLRIRRRVVPKPNGAEVRWEAKHAGAQNAGQMTVKEPRVVKIDKLVGANGPGDNGFRTLKPGVYKFKHYTTGGTGKGFVQVGLDRVVAKIQSYFK